MNRWHRAPRSASSKRSSPRSSCSTASRSKFRAKRSCSKKSPRAAASASASSHLLLWFLPGRAIERILSGGKRKTIDDLATIIFSSGSTGEPKGVMLTHYNIASNVDQVAQIFMFDGSDRLLGVLPFFHSFGFTVTLWLPAALGISVVYHPSPLDLAGADQRDRPGLPRDVPDVHADIPASLRAPMLCRRFRQLAICGRRRGKTSRTPGPRFRGPLRHPPAGRLRRHRMLARRWP